jgi:hypothetical protein
MHTSVQNVQLHDAIVVSLSSLKNSPRHSLHVNFVASKEELAVIDDE